MCPWSVTMRKEMKKKARRELYGNGQLHLKNDSGEMIDDWWEVGIVKQRGVRGGGGTVCHV